MERGEGNDTLGADFPAPVEDWRHLLRSGGDGADHRLVHAATIHGANQSVQRAIKIGLDLPFSLQSWNGDAGNLIGKGVGVDIDDAGHEHSSDRVCGGKQEVMPNDWTRFWLNDYENP